MPRKPRLILPGLALHIVQRGNNRTDTFRSPDDFALYREILHAAKHRYDCAIHAYVLMSNHVHLLVTTERTDGPALMMQSVGRSYVRYVNTRYNRTGTLWEGRFRSFPVDCDRYFLACSRYIEVNPVRAGMVARPRDYRWSSYRHNAGANHDVLVTPHAIYETLGLTPTERRQAYRALFRNELSAETLDIIRGTRRTTGVIGDDQFLADVHARLNRPLVRRCRGGDHRSAGFRAKRSQVVSASNDSDPV